MACKVLIATPDVTVIECSDMEERWHESMAAQCEAQWEEYEHDMNLADAEEHQHREAEFCDMREDVDPFWDVNWREEVERDPALVYPEYA